MSGTHRVAVVGIGNSIAGDDGVGIEVVRLLRSRWQNDERVLLATLEGDLFAIADLLQKAEKFLFVDAVPGDRVGELKISNCLPRCFAPSFHQTDIAAVMRYLQKLDLAVPFPEWQIWGIVIDCPQEFKPGLSPPVGAAARSVADRITRRLLRSCPNGRKRGPAA